MKLGHLQLSGNLVLAPMSGITDYPFRQIAKEHGCSLAFTEMVSADGLLRKGKSFLKIGEGEHPVSVQLFGSNPEVLAEAARTAESMGADAIDINMGCPAKQIVGPGAGADLMRFPGKVKEILTKFVQGGMRNISTRPKFQKLRRTVVSMPFQSIPGQGFKGMAVGQIGI
jgi:tRNA-dihydrouridine synthase